MNKTMNKRYICPRIISCECLDEEVLQTSVAIDHNTEIEDPVDVRSRRFKSSFDDEEEEDNNL